MKDDLSKFIERWLAIEGELAILREDKKVLLDEYKEQFKPTVIREAIRQAKLRTKMGDDVAVLDDLVAALDGRIH